MMYIGDREIGWTCNRTSSFSDARPCAVSAATVDIVLNVGCSEQGAERLQPDMRRPSGDNEVGRSCHIVVRIGTI